TTQQANAHLDRSDYISSVSGSSKATREEESSDMYLRKLIPHQFGPFVNDPVIEFDQGVTILTGGNDTGKSHLLKLIQFVLTPSQATPAELANVNIEHVRKLHGNWHDNEEFGCTAIFKNGSVDEEFTFRFYFAPNKFKGMR